VGSYHSGLELKVTYHKWRLIGSSMGLVSSVWYLHGSTMYHTFDVIFLGYQPCQMSILNQPLMMMMMMMMTKMVFETLVQRGHLTWLINREDYIKFSHYESSKTISNVSYNCRKSPVIFYEENRSKCYIVCVYIVLSTGFIWNASTQTIVICYSFN
jgi:hypothetical protein